MQSLGDPDSISIINLLSSHAAGCASEQTVSISSTKFIVALPKETMGPEQPVALMVGGSRKVVT